MLKYNTCVSQSTKHASYEVVFEKLSRLPFSEPLRESDLLPTYKSYLIDLVTTLRGYSTIFASLKNFVFSMEKLI